MISSVRRFIDAPQGLECQYLKGSTTVDKVVSHAKKHTPIHCGTRKERASHCECIHNKESRFNV
jgi:hypothetical protein